MTFPKHVSLLACSSLRIPSGSWTRWIQTPQDLGNISTFGVILVWVEVTAQDAKHCRIRPLVFPLPPEDKKHKNIIKTHNHLIHRPVPAILIQQGLPINTDSSPVSSQDSVVL